MKTAKDIDIGRIEVMVDKAFYSIIDKMKRNNLDRYIKEGWKNRLNKVQVSVSKRLRSCSGRAYWNLSKDKYKIKLHKDLPLNNGIKHKSIEGTIKHEVLHLITLQTDNKIFKRICDVLDIEKYHELNFSTKEKFKYKIICNNCNKVLGKRKRKTKIVKRSENYHSTCCKADIKVVKI